MKVKATVKTLKVSAKFTRFNHSWSKCEDVPDTHAPFNEVLHQEWENKSLKAKGGKIQNVNWKFVTNCPD